MQGEEEVSFWSAACAGPRHDGSRGGGQLHQICGRPGAPLTLPPLHEDPQEDQAVRYIHQKFFKKNKIRLYFFILIYCIEKKVDKVDSQFVTLAGTHHKF